jgi:hypothetical protein
MANEGGATLKKDAAKLQEYTGKLDPAAIWLDEPAQVTVMSSKLKGFSFNPLILQTYDFYAFHY